MRKSQWIAKFGAASLLAAVLAGLPVQVFSQITNKPDADKKTTATKETTKGAKKAGAGPFHGKLAAADKTAKTITVGKRTFQITSQTRINKAGKPAVLDDGVVGEEVSGYFKPTEDGKLVATTVRFGPKVEDKSSDKKKGSSEPDQKQER